MTLRVQKYGGTSMGSVERIQAVADRVIATRQAGHDVVVVVSAMSGETDRLVTLAHALAETPNPREYSMLVSTGEQASMALLALCLIGRGYPAQSLTGRQARILTDDLHHKARIIDIDPKPIQELLAEGKILIIAGFQGVDNQDNITTLGRGGSDTTAVAVAAALNAELCEIYTDVDGVYTADPRVVPSARRLSHITFEEMFEMASLGAKVLQRRSVDIAGRYRVPLRVLSSFEEGLGTLITFEDKTMERPLVSGIAFNHNEAKLTIKGVPDTPGIAATILEKISSADIDIDMIIQNIAFDGTTDFTFTVHRENYKEAKAHLETVSEMLGARGVAGNPNIAKISLVGVGMKTHPGIASTMFKTLGKEGINIQLISTSEIKISVVVDEKYLELGVRALHSAFHLDEEPQEEEGTVSPPQ
ncbi:MAG: aspartate kinase [Gammaproteobacteria bacterium]